MPGTVLADNLTMYLEENYTMTTLKTTDQTGKETTTNIKNFDQLYNLFLNKDIFPDLTFDLGGVFSRNNSAVKDGTEQHSSENAYNFFSDLRLNSRPYSAAVGYYKRTDTTVSQGSKLTTTDERYNAIFSWRPGPDLPSLDFNYTKDFNFDGRRLLFDDVNDQILLNLKYNPTSALSISYIYNFLDAVNKLSDSETTNTGHIGKIVYDDTFFNKRVHISSIYDISSQTLEASAGAGSVVQLQLFPVTGLSGISDLLNPNQTPLMITLNENPALIDGNQSASVGINIGLNSGLTTVPPPPRQEWNIGVDFITPTQLNTFFVWVNKDVTKIADLFKWDIYTSNDNVNWTKRFTVTVAPSGFSTLPLPHFVVNFPSAITSRYVKAVVKPLDSLDQTTILIRGLNPSDFNDIFITELQTYMSTTSTGNTSTKDTIITQHLSLNGRVKLLEKKDLSYDLTLFLARTDPNALTTAFLSNGLSYIQKFGGIFTGNARVARQDTYASNGHGVDYQYSAAVSATPLATLNDSLLYSGHYTTSTTGTLNIQNSIFLYNTAVLYPGANALLNGGITFGRLDTGQSSRSYQANAGLTVVPNQKMNLNLSYNITTTSLTGGGKAPSTVTNYVALAGATYTPVSALYLTGSIQFNEVNNTIQTLKNYGANFSPFPDGALQFHFVYTETLGPASKEKSRLISPSLRWNIRPGAFLDVAYAIQNSNLTTQKTDSKTLTASLKVSL